jgi:hypothetical protein
LWWFDAVIERYLEVVGQVIIRVIIEGTSTAARRSKEGFTTFIGLWD